MSTEKEICEVKRLGRSMAAIGFILWSVVPMYLLGWLASAVGRYPIAEEKISSEPIYKFLVWWQGGLNSFPAILILAIFILFLCVVSFILRRYGFSDDIDGMKPGREFVKKFLLPAIMSFGAFAAGILSGGSLHAMLPGGVVISMFCVLAGLIHYFIDATE